MIETKIMSEDEEIATKEVNAAADNSDSKNKSDERKKTNPPDGYVCKNCSIAGHWIQQCPQKKKSKKRKSSDSNQQPQHEYVPGVDPSAKDIDRAREMQKLKPPPCDCGIPSRVKKVKRSRVTEGSRAIGAYFFFCTKKKEDVTKCNFAQPVEDLQKSKKEKVQANFFAKKRKGF